MQDMIISVLPPFEAPVTQANFVVFRSERPAVPTAEGSDYFKKCKLYAREHKCYVVTELLNIADYLSLCMFHPEGKICGAQRALFLSKDNRALFQKCTNAALFDTPFGKVFLCVDADIYNPEVQRYARLKGCEILICSQFLPDYTEQKLFSGGWGAAQTNHFVVLCANNRVGAVCVPYLASPDNSGYLARPAQSASTVFNVNLLEQTPGGYASTHFNTALFAAHRNLL